MQAILCTVWLTVFSERTNLNSLEKLDVLEVVLFPLDKINVLPFCVYQVSVSIFQLQSHEFYTKEPNWSQTVIPDTVHASLPWFCIQIDFYAWYMQKFALTQPLIIHHWYIEYMNVPVFVPHNPVVPGDKIFSQKWRWLQRMVLKEEWQLARWNNYTHGGSAYHDFSTWNNHDYDNGMVLHCTVASPPGLTKSTPI